MLKQNVQYKGRIKLILKNLKKTISGMCGFYPTFEINFIYG